MVSTGGDPAPLPRAYSQETFLTIPYKKEWGAAPKSKRAPELKPEGPVCFSKRKMPNYSGNCTPGTWE